MAILRLRSELNLHTRSETQIQNEICRSDPPYGDHLQKADWKKKHPYATHRPVGPCRTYNCHGLTFASRRTGIWNPAEIHKILKEDEYHEINYKSIMIGDIALYHGNNGDIEHSGIIVSIDDFGPMILGKWGWAHEVIHRQSDCPYDASSVRYYRIIK